MRRAMPSHGRAPRHARPTRPLTATYRQRVGASDEARLALKEYSEFGQEPIPENTSEEDVTLTGDGPSRQAVDISTIRLTKAGHVPAGRPTTDEAPPWPSNARATRRTVGLSENYRRLRVSRCPHRRGFVGGGRKTSRGSGVDVDPDATDAGRKKRHVGDGRGAVPRRRIVTRRPGWLKSEGRIVAATDYLRAVDFGEVDWKNGRHALVREREVGISGSWGTGACG